MNKDADLGFELRDEDAIQNFDYSPRSAFIQYSGIALVIIVMLAPGLLFGVSDEQTGLPVPPPRGPKLYLDILLLFGWPLLLLAWRFHIRQMETGSQINLKNRKIIWWNGRRPAPRNIIDIDSLVSAKYDEGNDSTFHIELLEIDGQQVDLPGNCVSNPKAWIRALVAEFPQIKIRN